MDRPTGTAFAALLMAIFASAADVPAAEQSPESPDDESETEINLKITDPVSPTWSMKLQDNVYYLDVPGQGHPVQNTLVFQPSMPVWLTRDVKLITRPKFTLLESKPYTAGAELLGTTAVGDTVLDLALSPQLGPWLLGLGPTFVFPTANSVQTGQGEWQAGPLVAAGYRGDRWLAVAIAQQWWSFAGARGPVNALNLQYIASYHFGAGWSVGTSPTIKVDWEESPGNRVTFPFGPSIGKVVKLAGGVPVKLEVQVLYSPIHPDSNGQVVQIQFTATPAIPGLIEGVRFGG